jgi:hypothetical protein
MPLDQELVSTPPTTRALRTVKGARLELARLYNQTKTGAIEPQVAGRLSHILATLIGTARDHEVEERLAKLEAQLEAVKPNGHDRGPGHRP